MNPEYIVYDSVSTALIDLAMLTFQLSLRVEAEDDKISMRIMTSISPELVAELSPGFFGL